MADRVNPSMQRRRLKTALRQAREGAGFTQTQAAEQLDWSLSKLIRIEAGAVGVSVTDLKAMLALYRITDTGEVQRLTESARASKGQSPWRKYRSIISPQFAQYLDQEDSATSIRIFHPFLIPGLLQTPDYAASLAGSYQEAGQGHRLIEIRMKRQDRLFDQPGAPKLTFALNEEALYRWIGGARVMRQQLQHLLDMNAQPNASIRVVPFSAGAHPGLLGSFLLLSFTDDEDLLYIECISGNLINRDDRDMIAEYTEYFETVLTRSLPSDQTNELIDSIIKSSDSSEENSLIHSPVSGARPAAGELIFFSHQLPCYPADGRRPRWGVMTAGPQNRAARLLRRAQRAQPA